MPQIKKGTTRLVVLAGSYAFKLPWGKTWPLFLRGLLANMQERDFSGVFANLCPVVFAVWGGWLTIMLRADSVSEEELGAAWSSLPEEVREMAESKAGNYGRLQGCLVAVDYG